MKTTDQQILLLSTLIQLEQSARLAETVAELGFTMVNETLRLVPYRQAFFWTLSHGGKVRVRAVTAVDNPASDAPFIQAITTIIKDLLRSPITDSGRRFSAAASDGIDITHRELRDKWSLSHMLWCPLITPDQRLTGGLLMVRVNQWHDDESILLQRLADAYAHALWALERHRNPGLKKIGAIFREKAIKLVLVTAAIAALFLPVRLSVLAPMEIVALEPAIVTSPLDGIVKALHVAPNQNVEEGDLLISLEDTGIRNTYEVSLQALEVIRAQYSETLQKSLQDPDSRARLFILKAEVSKQEAEVYYTSEIMQLSKISSKKAGIAIYSDQEDWLGKPVSIGQKVMTIADPTKVEAEIMLSVADALNFEPGTEVGLFLNIAPDHPLHAALKRISYEAEVTPTGGLAFKIKATVLEKTLPRIGLRGTAKIYGKKVPLFYYLLRRPLTALRIAIGR
ncbi:MAG: HlyD family efflux transporter periplasmic adaptor subunit [Pseudomonadota bacterium]